MVGSTANKATARSATRGPNKSRVKKKRSAPSAKVSAIIGIRDQNEMASNCARLSRQKRMTYSHSFWSGRPAGSNFSGFHSLG